MQVDTVCRLCSSCCPITAHVEQDRLVAAKRKTPLPPDKAWLCPKLAASADIVYSPERLQNPLIRQPDNSYRQASWDEALDLVADRLLQCRQQHGAQSVAWLRGMAADWGAPWDYVNRLMNAFGSPNSIGNGSVCHVAREMAHNYTYGAMTIPQIQKSDCIVVWGKNDQHTNPPAYDAIIQARERGARLIVVDPIRTGLAAMADIWLQIKPAHDGPLAMAMIDQIIRCGWHNAEFVAQWTTGFEELRQAAAHYRAEDIADRLSLNPADIIEATRLYAQSETACIIDGNGLDMQLEVFDATRAVAMLRALSGNLDQAGGDLIPQPVAAHNIQLKERLPEDSCPVTSDYPLFSTFHHNWGLHAQSCVIDAILEGRPYPIKSLLVQSGNPAVTMTDSNRVNRALSQLDFLVVIDLFMTRTAQYADVILPASSCFEKTQLNRAYLRNSLVILQNQVIEPLHNSWPDWKIIFELGRRLGLKEEFPWKCVEDAIDYQLEPCGVTVAALREQPEGIRTAPIEHQKYKEKGFATPSGKVEFASERLQQAGFSAVPFADGRLDNPISFAGQAENYPMIGISGARSSCFTHSQFHHVPMLRQQETCPTVDIHPADAKHLDISNGDQVELTSPRGEITLTGRINRDMKPGTVRIAWGWGENEPNANLNNLTDDYRRNPITGTPNNRSFMCRIRKSEHQPQQRSYQQN